MVQVLMLWATASAGELSETSPIQVTADATLTDRMDSTLPWGHFAQGFDVVEDSLRACEPPADLASVVVDLQVGSEGRTEAKVEGGTPEFRICVVAKLEALGVPGVPDGTVAHLPTVFGNPEGASLLVGTIDRTLIDEVIKRHIIPIRKCYQRQLARKPALKGKVVMKFVIEPDGTVQVAHIKKESTTLQNEKMHACMIERFQEMEFPKPGGIAIVTYPFLFSPD